MYHPSQTMVHGAEACSTQSDFSLIDCGSTLNENILVGISKHTKPFYCLILVMTG
jgi:MinD-like ATPase involved in chromosome partitioning or flagellar assembly